MPKKQMNKIRKLIFYMKKFSEFGTFHINKDVWTIANKSNKIVHKLTTN